MMTTNKKMREFMEEIDRVLEEDTELITLEIFMNTVDETIREYGLNGATEVTMLIPTEFRENPYPVMRELVIAGYGWDRSGNWLTIHWGH